MFQHSFLRLVKQSLSEHIQNATFLVLILMLLRRHLGLEELCFLLRFLSRVWNRRINERANSGRKFSGSDTQSRSEIEDLGLDVVITVAGVLSWLWL